MENNCRNVKNVNAKKVQAKNNFGLKVKKMGQLCKKNVQKLVNCQAWFVEIFFCPNDLQPQISLSENLIKFNGCLQNFLKNSSIYSKLSFENCGHVSFI